MLSDRDRIVRDLHDHVIQQLFAHGLSLHGVHQRARSPELQRRLAAMIDDVHDVVREALSNAVRHAQASSVTVTVTAEDELVIEVVDDGSGIPESVVTSGLRNLHERAVTANGEFAVRSPGGWYGADLVGAVRLI